MARRLAQICKFVKVQKELDLSPRKHVLEFNDGKSYVQSSELLTKKINPPTFRESSDSNKNITSQLG